MKPRLKYAMNGRLSVVAPGRNPWGEENARKFVIEHYGSLAAFAKRYRLPYNSVVAALKVDQGSEKMAGKVAHVRQVLGLPSRPTFRATVAAQAKARQRGEGEPDWVFGVEVQP